MDRQDLHCTQSCPAALWSMGATVDAVEISLPSPTESLSNDVENLPGHQQADAEQHCVTTQTGSDAAAPGTLLQTPPTQHHTAPQSSGLARDQSRQAPDLRLPPRPPHVLLTEDIAYFARLRNLRQMQDQFLHELADEEQDEGAIDDMARRQLGLGYEISPLGQHHLRPAILATSSQYGNAYCSAQQCQFGWRNRRGRLICWDRNCERHGPEGNKRRTDQEYAVEVSRAMEPGQQITGNGAGFEGREDVTGATRRGSR